MMPKSWCWSSCEGRGRRVSRGALACGILLAVGSAEPASGATVARREVTLTVEKEGYLVRESWLVELTAAPDLERWSWHDVYLDADRELVDSSFEVEDGKGRRLTTVASRDYQRLASPGNDLFNSGWLVRVPFPKLAVGQVLKLAWTIRHRPVFSTAVIPLSLDDPQARLAVEVVGEGIRWHLNGHLPQLAAEATAAGLVVRAEGLEAWSDPPWSPAPGSVRPALWLAWGRHETWPAVGAWYTRFTAKVPRQSPAVAELAREITRDLATAREKLEALTLHVKRKVRYESVQIGEGGWRPMPGEVVLAQGWGDCKGKAELLLGMLDAVGLPGHLALLRAGQGQRIATELPSPFQFNHAIVALPAALAGAGPDDPVAGDLLFVDPTIEHGGASWLAPSDQGRDALVVAGEASRLVRTPVRAEGETRRVAIVGRLDGEGRFAGTYELELTGGQAVEWIAASRVRSPERMVDALHQEAHRLLPGARLVAATWTEKPAAAVPAVTLRTQAELDSVLRGEGDQRSLKPGARLALPASRDLAGRSVPAALPVGVQATSWRLELPPGVCPPAALEEVVENTLGRSLYRLSSPAPRVLLVERELTFSREWVEPLEFPALLELVGAATRPDQKRLRLGCGAAAVPAA